MIDGNEYKICRNLINMTSEMIRNWDKEINGNLYQVRRQVTLRCPITNELVPERICSQCPHNFGKSSEKWIYCAPETTKVRGNRILETKTSGFSGVWKDMAGIYRKMGLSETEIKERIICKTTKSIDRSGNWDRCDNK